MSTEGHIPHDAPRAEDVAIRIDLPSGRNSLDQQHLTFDGFHLEAVDANAQVHPSSDIVKDVKTGKHYRKVINPSWSIAQAAQVQKSKGQPTAEGRRAHGTNFSVGHAIGASGKRTPGTGGATTPVSSLGNGMNGHDMAQLVEKLRAVVREEVRVANIGHAEHLERVIDTVQAPLARVSSSSSEDLVSGAKLNSEKRTDGDDQKTPRLITETEAARGVDSDSLVEEAFPNPWAKLRYKCREPFAEFMGTFFIITFGCGGNIQALLSPDVVGSAFGQYLSVSFGWGIGVCFGVFVSGGISGQLNPAVTLSMALFRGFPWKKVPIYCLAQVLGATLGGLMILGLYKNALDIADPGKTQATAALLTTFPAPFLEPAGARISGFYNEVYATAILLMAIVGINDVSNTPPPEGMAPLILLWLVTGIGACLGWQTAYAINPARDLGPRIALSIVGYRGIWTYGQWYWLRTPFLGPLIGGPLGVFIYDALIYTGADSPLNKTWRWSDVQWRKMSKKKIPAGVN